MQPSRRSAAHSNVSATPVFVQVVLLQFLSDCKVLEFEPLREHVLSQTRWRIALLFPLSCKDAGRMEVLALGPAARFCGD